jgi:hypothetical protein
MPASPLAWIMTVAAVWAVTAVLLWWGSLSGNWRRSAALIVSGAAIYFLVQATRAEGVRESPTLRVFLLGTPYESEQASASASLPYYVLTGVCLLFGTLGLAVGDDTARRLTRRWEIVAIGLGLLTTVLRLALEKVAAPPSLTFGVGVTWFPPIVGAFFAHRLRAEGRGLRSLVAALLVYAVAVRTFVVIVMMAATLLHFGTHYDVSSVTQVSVLGRRLVLSGFPVQILWLALILIPQLLFWPVFTLAAGLLGAGVSSLVALMLPGVRTNGVAAAPREASSER